MASLLYSYQPLFLKSTVGNRPGPGRETLSLAWAPTRFHLPVVCLPAWPKAVLLLDASDMWILERAGLAVGMCRMLLVCGGPKWALGVDRVGAKVTEENCRYSLVLGHLPCLVCGALGLDPLYHRKHQSSNNSN